MLELLLLLLLTFTKKSWKFLLDWNINCLFNGLTESYSPELNTYFLAWYFERDWIIYLEF